VAMATPQQARLDETVPDPTVYHGEVTQARMINQWKTSSNYINQPGQRGELNTPSIAPIEFVPGSTASGWRRSHKSETALPYGAGATSTFSWPPQGLSNTHSFSLASYPPTTVGGPHLMRRVITAGLGGIDPKRA